MENKNSRQTALVTGASSGIGYEYARQLAERGYNLLIVSNQEEQLQKVADDLAAEFGIQATPRYLNLAQPDAARQLYDYCQESGIEVDVLINNAGIFSFADIADTSPERLETMTTLHVVTPTLLCHYFGEAMRQRQRGYILNMSSLSAWTPFQGIAVYSATKAYLDTFSRAFHAEMKPFNVGVTSIAPGAVATGLYRLTDNLRNLGTRLGIILPAEKLAKIALRNLFKKRMAICPGFINRLFIVIFPLIPECVRRYGKKKLSKYEW